MTPHKLLSVKEAAEALGVSDRRVRALIADGKLPAKKIGLAWLIKRVDLSKVADRRPGKPRKQ